MRDVSSALAFLLLVSAVGCVETSSEDLRYSCRYHSHCAPGQRCTGVEVGSPGDIALCDKWEEKGVETYRTETGCMLLYCIDEGDVECGDMGDCGYDGICIEKQGFLHCYSEEDLNSAESDCGNCPDAHTCAYVFAFEDGDNERCVPEGL